MADMVLMEILLALSDELHRRQAKEALAKLWLIEVSGFGLAEKTVVNYRTLRARGLSANPAECRLATFRIDQGFALLHSSAGYNPFEKHPGVAGGGVEPYSAIIGTGAMRILYSVSIGVVVILAAYFLLWYLPERSVERTRSLPGLQCEQLMLEERKTNAQILGGGVLLLGLYFTWRNLRVAEEGKITERFTKAVDQLGSEKIEQRVGGIFALERLAKDSRYDHASIVELVCTFLRHRVRTAEEAEPYKKPIGIPEDRDDKFFIKMEKLAGWSPWPPEDVRAAAGVLRRNRLRLRKPHAIDLSHADLRRVNLEGAHLQEANLVGIYGDYLNLEGANLQGADLSAAHLKWANLDRADLQGALVDRANLSYADLRKANLRNIKTVATLEYDYGFELDPVYDEIESERISVNLEYADLRDANLEGVDFEKTNLRSANLSTAVGLSSTCIEHAYGNKKTQLPPEVARPPEWEREEE